LFFADPRVINRVTHFSLARCKLCVKFVLSGNPFLFGQLLASYMPFPTSNSTISTTNDGRAPAGTGITTELVLSSQRPHVFLTPMMSEGACMELPFFCPNNWFQVQVGDWVDFGYIYIQVMNQLKHANAGTESVSVNVFAWAEDMELSVPTSYAAYGMVAQAGMDEYKTGSPASVLNAAVGAARAVSSVTPYTMATSVAAGALSGAANALGYSRPANLEPARSVRQDTFKDITSTDIEDNSAKLTLDSKQGVTIDTRVMGLAGVDEMNILYMAQKESYLTTFTWSVGTASDTHLFSIPVTPMLYSHWGSTTPSATVIAPTAIAAASLPFNRWRGTIIFRFQVICTPYHKGRLRVLYDPYALSSFTKFNVNYTKIVDLSEVNEFEMKVSWADDKLVQFVNLPDWSAGTANPWSSTTTAYVPSQLYDNGVLSVLILNALTAPNDTIDNSVGVNVFVRAGDDFEVYEPRADFMQSVMMTPQAGYDELDNPMDVLTIGDPSDGTDLSKVIIGERVVSFRQLLKRYTHYMSSKCVTSATVAEYYYWVIRNYPLTPGSDASGIHTSVGLAKTVNFVSMTLLSYLSSMFSAYRGSIRYKHVLKVLKSSALTDNIMMVCRNTGNSVMTIPTIVSDPITTYGTYAYNATLKNKYTFNGAALTVTHHKPAVEVELPYYSASRFLLPIPMRNNANTGPYHTLIADRPVSVTDSLVSWVSVGEDFTLGFFIGANLWYQYYLVA
jgi:hypothetical protein